MASPSRRLSAPGFGTGPGDRKPNRLAARLAAARARSPSLPNSSNEVMHTAAAAASGKSADWG